MDKYEFQIKTEQMEKLLDKKDYETAAKIADSIDWRKVRNVGLLMEVAEAYEGCGHFEDCYEILNIAYDCSAHWSYDCIQDGGDCGQDGRLQ